MSKIIQVQGKVSFQPVCVVCLSPANKHYTIDRTFSYGREAIVAQVDIPLCDRHHAVAVRKSPAEKIAGRLGFWVGLLLGLAAAAGIVIYWAGRGEGSLIPNIFLALVLGTGFFLIVWSATLFWLAPRLADRDSLRVREAVRILRYWPGDQLMELEVANDRTADLVVQSPVPGE